MSSQESGTSAIAGDIHILHAGDNEASAGRMKAKLEKQSRFRVENVADGDQTLRRLRERHYHVALVHSDLPGLTGPKLLNILKDGDVDLPVIILDADHDKELADQVKQAGASDYLSGKGQRDFSNRICRAVHTALEDGHGLAQHKHLFTKRKLADKVFDVSKEGIVVTDAENRIEAVNPAFTEITGFSFEEVAGKNPSILNSGRHDGEFYQRMWDALQKNGEWEGEIWNRKKSGVIFPEWLTISAVREGDVVTHYIGVFTDISKRKADEECIWRQANYDELTDLPNRTLLVDRAWTALQRSRREKRHMAVIFIDLDRFKYINDHYGHAAGDELLLEVSGRITSMVRKSDTVARISGDEFVVMMPLIRQAGDAARVAEKVLAEISKPYLVCDNKTYISASAGIAVFPGDGEQVETLLNHADVAMYKAKDAGRNQYVFFDQQMNNEAEERARMEVELLTAIRENQLVMYYQPVYELSNNRVTHAEALIRWQHPERGLVPPNDFVPIAEECGLIIQLGEWVVNEVCRQLDAWRKTNGTHVQVLLNVSPIQLMHANLDKQLADAMQQYGLTGDSLGIEITENVLIDGPDKIKQVLDGMKAGGMHFLLDDFGTGFSSMRYLRMLPLDGLKIDRAFVTDVDQDREKGVLVKAMIGMAHSLNLSVVAEGVENEGELTFLREHGCDFIQGYLLGRPMPAEAFFNLLQER